MFPYGVNHPRLVFGDLIIAKPVSSTPWENEAEKGKLSKAVVVHRRWTIPACPVAVETPFDMIHHDPLGSVKTLPHKTCIPLDNAFKDPGKLRDVFLVGHGGLLVLMARFFKLNMMLPFLDRVTSLISPYKMGLECASVNSNVENTQKRRHRYFQFLVRNF
jgi:hypothetical protein